MGKIFSFDYGKVVRKEIEESCVKKKSYFHPKSTIIIIPTNVESINYEF